MKYLILITTCVSILTIGLNGQNHQEIESPTSEVLSLNSTGSSSTVVNFLNSNAALAGGSNKRAYISTNGNILNFGLSNNNTGGRIEFFGQGLRRMTMSADGRFGIGNIIPTQQLDVDGQARIRNLPLAADTDSYVTVDASGNLRKKNSVSPTYVIGDFAQGGIVFWVDETGQRGLVCAKSDQSSGIRWSAGTNGNTRAYGDGPYSGEANTTIIIAAHVAIGDDGDTYAARLCNELIITEGGKTYGDWYLPSNDELLLIYQNKAAVDAAAMANGGSMLSLSQYWSSTEQKKDDAQYTSFSNGFEGFNNKPVLRYVRAVRAF